MRSPTRSHTFHFGDVRLLAPVQHVEPAIRQVVEARLDFGVIVIKFHPILGERVANTL